MSLETLLLPESTEASRVNSGKKLSTSKSSSWQRDLPILIPPEGFRAPVFRCKGPTSAWQPCSCTSHPRSHMPPRRSLNTWSAFKRCGHGPFYQTWPNRAAKRFIRPARRTVGTQSTLDGKRSSLAALRCVVRSIDMTESSLDLEIGATIPF